MKKIYIISLTLVLCLCLTACGRDKDNNSRPITNDQTPSIENTQPDNKTPEEENKISFENSAPIEVEKVEIFDADAQEFTKDTLPENMYNIDFDTDGLSNKEEIDLSCDMYKSDTDGDGIKDGEEVKETLTDPLKWSSRDDNISDLEYVITNRTDFEEGWTATDANGFKVYLKEAKDQLFVISKTSTDVFDDLETISEAFQIKYFSGKLALNVNKYIEEVAQSIAIYKVKNNKAIKVETTIDEDRLVQFELNENDIFVVVYEEPTLEITTPELLEEIHNN